MCPAAAWRLRRWVHHQSEDRPPEILHGMTWGSQWRCSKRARWTARFADYVNHDFAEYHIATNADVGKTEVAWIDEGDSHVNPMGAKGIGELGIANAVYHATGIRVRDLPNTLDKPL